MGTAAAGAAVLGAVAGATTLAPQVGASPASKDRESGGAKPAATISRPVTLIPSTWDYSADVVVVGYGGAGAAAAIGAHDGGASVLILEKAPKGLAGGNTGVSGGNLHDTHALDGLHHHREHDVLEGGTTRRGNRLLQRNHKPSELGSEPQGSA